MSGETPAAPAGAAIVTSRVLGAPPEAVYGAFADPEVLMRWWGPEGFSNAFEEFDLRPGGAWRLVMRGPDGAEFRMAKEFVVVAPGERVALRHLDAAHGFLMEMTFEAEGAGTRLTWSMTFDSPAEAARVREAVLRANEQNLDRLEAVLIPSE